MRTFVVDSFTDVRFKGNPAGVCFPQEALSDELMLSIANELQYSETAFVQLSEAPNIFSIRFFSPKMEIPLCGHATLASASTVFDLYNLKYATFVNVEGVALEVEQWGEWIRMVFPEYPLFEAEIPRPMMEALGIEQIESSFYNSETNILVIEISDATQLKSLQPDYVQLVASHSTVGGVLVMAEGDENYDYYYRHFWPWNGTNEDPVTGAVQSFLGPYWSRKLGKTQLKAFQPSARSGFMNVHLHDDKVFISGKAVRVLEGQFLLD